MVRTFALAGLLALAACGGGSGGGSGAGGAAVVGSTPVAGQANVAPVYVDGGPQAATVHVANAIYADVKVCMPGSLGICTVIRHVLVDTGSVGLRLMASALPANLLASLPPVLQGAAAVGECLAFGSGVTWGGVRRADLRLGGGAFDGQLAASLAVQVIADPDARFATVPARCAAQGAMMQTAAALGANGILGIGLFAQDCGAACANAALQVYYLCAQSGGCVSAAMPLASQVANPLQAFARDNNGSIVVLPALTSRAATRLDGLLVFGIGTQSNNAMPAGSVVLGASSAGYFQSSFNGNSLPNSFIDSGSSVNFLPPSGQVSLPVCGTSLARFLCPLADTTLVASNTGRSPTRGQAQVLVVNAANAFLAAPNANAYLGLAAASTAPYASLDLGASFFIGRSVATLIEARTANGFAVAGPAFAYSP